MKRIREFRKDRVLPPPGFAQFSPPPGPLDIEIGCGNGIHPIRHALLNPDRSVVAIERTLTRFSSFARRLEREARPLNLLALRADGISWAVHALRPSSVDRWFFLYPNPHPRTRDRGKRWYANPFFQFVKETLKPGGVVTFRTNLRFYSEEAREWLAGEWGLGECSVREIAKDPERALTAFERKYLARGECCYEINASL